MINEAIKLAVEGKDLGKPTCEAVAREIMSGNVSEMKIAAFLTSLRMKGETAEEIASFARVMREFCSRINPKVNGTLVDTCGTGGDRLKTFNVSTAAAFVVAGAGIPVAKHGNRSVTSKCGSADILEALGVNLNLTPEQVERSIEKVGIGFMFAPNFHPATRNVQNVRRELGIRTIFNVLGPLTNPAGAKAQVIGVYDKSLTLKIANALRDLGVERALVVHGSGMDEITTLGTTYVAELKAKEVIEYTIHGDDFGIAKPTIDGLYAKDIETSMRFFKEVLEGKGGPRLDIVLLNAAAGIYVGGKAETIAEGLDVADESIKSGNALSKLEQLVEDTQRYL
jgi:anthranilate phosphoribosyltransferase